MESFVKFYRYYLGYAFFFSMFINILQLTFSIYMLQVYDRVLTSYNIPTLWVITFAAIVALVVLALLDWIRARLLIRASIDLDDRLGQFVLSNNISQVANRTGLFEGGSIRDVQLLRSYLCSSAINAYFDIPWMPLYFILIFVLHPVLGLVALSGGIVILLLGVLQQRLNQNRIKGAENFNAQSTSFTNIALNNAGAIKAMGMIDSVASKWRKVNNATVNLQASAAVSAGLLHSISKSFRLAMQVFIYAAGAYLAVTHESTPGIMIAASIIMGRSLGPIDQAMATYKQSLEAKEAYTRLKTTIRAEKPKSVATLTLPAPDGDISFEDVIFSIGERVLIKQLTFRLGTGESLAIIGPSASGKSTLCKLLLGLWQPVRGKVRIDNADISSWDSENLGKHMGYLPQDVALFPGTIAENIARLGTVESEKVIAAAKAAGVHEMILKLPENYETRVGDNREPLSGGQRQRLGLARALFGEPAIVVLDEPNSNLDEEGERCLTQSLIELKRRGATVVIVTHKPAALATVDKIMMLQDGMLTLMGDRQDVLTQLDVIKKQKQLMHNQQEETRRRQEAMCRFGSNAL